jgi:ribose 5-phosphate isomerase RpiB
MIVEAFLTTPFSSGRHARRLENISALVVQLLPEQKPA